jgi:hypothetical protein
MQSEYVSGQRYGTSALAPKGAPSKPAGMEMVERKEPEFVKFAAGEVVAGILLAIDEIAIGDPSRANAPKKAALKFTVEIEDGKRVSFLGSYDIVSKLQMSDIGHYIIVRYEGEDKAVSRNGNALKRFSVSVSTKPVRTGTALEASLGITNDDIGF